MRTVGHIQSQCLCPSLAADEQKLLLFWPSSALAIPDPAASASPTCVCSSCCLCWLSAPLTPWKWGTGTRRMGRAKGAVRWRSQINSEFSHPQPLPVPGMVWRDGDTGRRDQHGAVPLAVSRECWRSCLSLSHTPLPATAALQPRAPSRAGNTHGLVLGLAWGRAGSSFRCSLHAPEPVSPALWGAAEPCRVPGAAPSPAPGGRTLDAGVADSAFGPRKSFCLSCRVSSRREGAWPGLGEFCPLSPGSAEPTVSLQSCASLEDDSLSFRSRAASCATDSTSEDALSIRSEMIQRKGTRLEAVAWGSRRGLGSVVWS